MRLALLRDTERRRNFKLRHYPLPILVDTETADRAWTATVELAERFQLSLYDAAYLELALRRKLPLATLDAVLIRAAKASGATVLPT